MKASEFNTVFRQGSIWVADFQPSVRQVMALWFAKWASRLDGEPSVLPAAADLPADIPRVTLTSADRIWRLEVAPHRVNLIWSGEPTDDPLKASADFSAAVFEVVEPFIALSEHIRVSRLAYVVRRYHAVKDPGRQLAQYFCRPELLQGPLNRPENFELHAHKAYQPQGLPVVNSWVRWRTALVGGSKEPCVFMENDLNTLAESMPSASYRLDEVKSFFALAAAEADAILAFYLKDET